MDDRVKPQDKSGRGLAGDRLRRLAAEASRHLDEALPGGEAASVVEKLVGSGTVEASGERPAASRPTEEHAVVTATDEEPANQGDSGTGKPAALVVHVSKGMAKILANLLNHMGFRADVASNSEEFDSSFLRGHRDILFVQGSSFPYPGRSLAARVANCYSQSGPPVVLLARPGDALLPEAARWEAVGLLRWPFSPNDVGETLAEVLATVNPRRRRQAWAPGKRSFTP
jgi:hypothetical protein